QIELTHKAFVPVGSWSVLAMEAYGLYTPGDVPLGELPALGGSSRLRGYFQGRYRDHLYLTGQVEWRIHAAGAGVRGPVRGGGQRVPRPRRPVVRRDQIRRRGRHPLQRQEGPRAQRPHRRGGVADLFGRLSEPGRGVLTRKRDIVTWKCWQTCDAYVQRPN